MKTFSPTPTDVKAIANDAAGVTMTRQEARDLIDANDNETFIGALDEKQGDAEGSTPQYLVIKIEG